VIYNLIHVALRWGLFRAGYEKGDGVVADIARLSLPRLADRLRLVGALLCGAAAGLLALAALGAGGAGLQGGAGALAVVAGASLGYLALARGAPLLTLAYLGAILTAALAVAAAALGGRWNGGS